jgi:hypothetical protein
MNPFEAQLLAEDLLCEIEEASRVASDQAERAELEREHDEVWRIRERARCEVARRAVADGVERLCAAEARARRGLSPAVERRIALAHRRKVEAAATVAEFKLAAIMAVDVVGYSRLIGRAGQGPPDRIGGTPDRKAQRPRRQADRRWHPGRVRQRNRRRRMRCRDSGGHGRARRA